MAKEGGVVLSTLRLTGTAQRGFTTSSASFQRERSIRRCAARGLSVFGRFPRPGARDHGGRSRVGARTFESLETSLEPEELCRRRGRKLRLRDARVMLRFQRLDALGGSGGFDEMAKLLDLRPQSAHIIPKPRDFRRAGRVQRHGFRNSPIRRRRETAGAQAEFHAQGGARENRQRQRAPEGSARATSCDRKAQARKYATLDHPGCRRGEKSLLGPAGGRKHRRIFLHARPNPTRAAPERTAERPLRKHGRSWLPRVKSA